MSKRVLVVDDSESIRTLLTTHLTLAEYDVTEATDGREGLEILARDPPPDVVILDWMMPEMEGPEIARRIRASGNEVSYVIMLTAKTATKDQIIGLRTGVDLYLTKPFEPEVLMVQVSLGVEQSQRRREAESNKRLALHDKLTGLGNRRAFDEALVSEASRAQRAGQPLTLVMVDLDHFKAVNDTYGHQVGDAVLADLGKIIRQVCRKSDRPFRYGGEEFAILLPETGREGGLALAEKLRHAVEAHEFDQVGHKSASLGVALLGPTEEETACVARADAALYQSKKNGRNRVTMAD